jgi:hypothetical protein
MEMEFLQLQVLYGGKQTTEKKYRVVVVVPSLIILVLTKLFILKKYLSVIINFGTLCYYKYLRS